MARASTEDELRDFARLQVRAGLLDPERQLAEVISATEAEMPHTDATILARAWLAAARQETAALASTWPPVTDFDRLQRAFAECEEHGLPVLQGVEGPAVVTTRLAEMTAPLRGTVWFTPADVWDAVDHQILRLEVWHPTSVGVAPGDLLLTQVLACFERHGLPARFAEDRVEVAARWERRP